MEANNASAPAGHRVCRLCNRWFVPHPKAQTRQRVCGEDDCQQLRQKLNQLDYLERHPVDHQTWYQDYGKAWRQKNPDYQKQYRQQKQAKPYPPRRTSPTKLLLTALLQAYRSQSPARVEKKEQLTVTKTATTGQTGDEKKEQLTSNFYLLQAKDLVLWPLAGEKKEQLAYSFV